MQLEHGWIPDIVQVRLDALKRSLELTLIELEATEANALISSRKYLPEDKATVISRFDSYLGIVLKECRRTGDPRRQAIEQLLTFVRSHPATEVFAAAALRKGARLLECRPLVNHAEQMAALDAEESALVLDPRVGVNQDEVAQATHPRSGGIDQPTFEGTLQLTRRESETIKRAILIVDAVIRDVGASDAALRKWCQIQTKRLSKDIPKSGEQCPALLGFLATDKRRGGPFPCEAIFQELSALWSASRKGVDPEKARELVRGYFNTASGLRQPGKARPILRDAKDFVERMCSAE
jgi:hypothetical protein